MALDTKTAHATATHDLERNDTDSDAITPSSLTPDAPRSKTSSPAPDRRRSAAIQAAELPHHNQHNFHKPRICATVEEKIPQPVLSVGRKVAAWVKGPEPARVNRISPLFEKWQMFPNNMIRRLPSWLRVLIYAAACVLWVVLFAVILTNFSLPTSFLNLGSPTKLSCVSSLWPGPQSCGLNGKDCLPFDNATFAFSCPAGCAGVKVLNPRAIGNVSINYRSLVVGGQATGSNGVVVQAYRGDSFICGAAIHAGVIADGKGGCGVLSLVGTKRDFQASTANGIASVGFDASFPLSFSFNTSPAIASASSQCRDPRWNLLALSTTFTALFGLFTTHPATFFAPVFTILFFQIGMASDPPNYSTYASLASTILARFLPAALAMAFMYKYTIRRTLTNCRAPLEKTILWLGGAWTGALGNYTFDQIPISRLTGHDIRQQPGAITALVIIVLILFAIILYQAHCLRFERRLPRFLGLYAILGLTLGVLAAMPGLNLRIHHYILALLLLPGTALQTRLSLLYQGLLIGLFVNGVARWDFDSILQTSDALRADALLGSVIPSILDPVIANASIAFSWRAVPSAWDGVSVLVNDVERFRGTKLDLGFVWNRTDDATFTNGTSKTVEYFRFGFVRYSPFGGVAFSDYTRAGSWDGGSAWSGIQPGRTGI